MMAAGPTRSTASSPRPSRPMTSPAKPRSAPPANSTCRAKPEPSRGKTPTAAGTRSCRPAPTGRKPTSRAEQPIRNFAPLLPRAASRRYGTAWRALWQRAANGYVCVGWETGPMNDHSLQTVRTALSGYELLNDPLLNKGTAFTEAERDAFELHGLLPPHIATLDYQVKRRLDAFRKLGSDMQRYVFLRGLQDSNETLFYALLTRNIEEMMPIVYTPTVGLGCQQFSSIFRKPRGLFLSYPHKADIRRILANPRFDDVEAIVVSDGERILGLGDQGAGGMGIPIGKLALYTACAGLHPAATLPIILDVGTDSREHLDDPQYIGWQHQRMRGAAYDEFIATFVAAVRERWPHVLLHWVDFAIGNANPLLARYRDSLCTFNDDIQGTAAIAVGTLLSAINVTGTPLTEQRVAVFGAGSAGTGICALLLRAMVDAGVPEAEARSRFYLVDRDGLLVAGTAGLQTFQAPFAQRRDRITGWKLVSP